MIGTPRNMPSTPAMLPPTVMATMIQRGRRPTDCPRIFGPRQRPSNCCKPKIMMMKITALKGLTISIMIAPGTAPIKGPKQGIMFVIPTIRLISRVYGRRRIVMRMKHRIPMIRESMAFPMTKPPKISLHSFMVSTTYGILFWGKKAQMAAFTEPTRIFLSSRI